MCSAVNVTVSSSDPVRHGVATHRHAEARPVQAVILAGGLGTRLAPITHTTPKPMVPFHGRPFLAYLIDLLKQQGFTKVMLLLGYLAPKVQAYFGDGSRFGITIEYSVTPVEDDTGRRIWHVRERLDPLFLLMYGDNYWPMPFDRMWAWFSSHTAPAMVTIYRNDEGYSKDNVIIDTEGMITTYDKSRQATGLKGVELGFMLLRREILARLPDQNCSFEKVMFPHLSAQRQLLAFVTDHRYYSVSTPERLPLTADFLARQPTVILDRDGVLNEKMARAHYVCSWQAWRWLPGSLEALRRFKQAGYRVIVVTNQAGIARGAMTSDDLETIHRHMHRDIEAAGGKVDAVYHCPHGWDEGCHCRKPKPGMLFQAQRDFHLDLSRLWFVGDDTRDGMAAEAAGCRFAMVTEQEPLGVVAERILAT